LIYLLYGLIILCLLIRGYVEIVDYLLSKGADAFIKNASGAQALHLAASNGKSKIVDILAELAGMDIWCKDDDGHTPIDLALASGYKSLASRLAYHSCVARYTERLYQEFLSSQESHQAAEEL
jgi:ankyrin repeat protein